MPLQAVEPQRLYRQIADQLRTLIQSGEFVAGSRLPAERDLAKQLGVSRPSVREVYVLDRAQHTQSAEKTIATTEWGPLELIRARRVVEGEMAAIAALQAKRKHLDAMRQALADMTRDASVGVLPLEGDRAFHSAIVESTGNVVLVETVHSFWDSRRGPLFTRLGGYFETVQSWRSAIAEHTTILDAIAAHDGPGARAAMHTHMDKSHHRFSASWRRAKAA